MSFTRWLRLLRRTSGLGGSPVRQNKGAKRLRLQLDHLEDRTVPAAPALTNVGLTSVIRPGAAAMLTGTIVDSDPQEALTLVVNWGDGSAAETFNFSGGTTSFSKNHTFASAGTDSVALALRGSDHSAGTLYGSTTDGKLYTLNLSTGAATLVGSLPGSNVTEIVYDNFANKAWLQYGNNQFKGQQFNINTGAAIGSQVSDSPAENFNGLTFNGAKLYATGTANTGGTSPSDMRLLNPATGSSDSIGATGINGPVSGLAFNEKSAVLYGIKGGSVTTNNLVSINLATGSASTLFSTNFAGGGLAYGPDGKLYGGSNSGQLYRIDTTNQTATQVGTTGLSVALSGLTVVDPLASGTGGAQVSVNAAPTASTGGPYSINMGAPLTLSATASDPENDPLTYSWDINGDGTYGDATGANPTLTWAQLDALGIGNTNSYNVRVSVNDSHGAVVSAPATLTVVGAPPYAASGVAAFDPGFVEWASNVVALNRGPMDISDPGAGNASYGASNDALGTPDGDLFDANTHVVSLGDGGSITVSFANPIRNGSGTDFAVFENGFAFNGGVYAELGFVEVSSDGTHFVRFPSISRTPTTSQIGFDAIDPTLIHNLAGQFPALEGAAFDLQDLSGASSFLDINAVRYVRVVDAVGSINPLYAQVDSLGHVINDPWSTPYASGGFDLDAVGVIHQQHAPTGSAGGPYSINFGQTLALSAAGSVDPDGDPLTYSWDINGDSVYGDATGVAPVLTWAQLNALGITGAVSIPNVRVQVSDGIFPAVTSSSTTLLVRDNSVITASFFDSAVYEIDAQTGAVVKTLVAPNSQATLQGPAGATVGPDGNLYLSSMFNNAIVQYNVTTNSLSTFINLSSFQPATLAIGLPSGFAPAGLRFGPDGNLYVNLNGGQSATNGGAVIRFDINNNNGVLSYAGAHTAVASGLVQPTEMTFGTAVNDVNNLYVSTANVGPGTGNVLKITRADSATPSQATFIAAGSGGLNYPAGFAWGADGKLYVIDVGTTAAPLGQVLRFNADGSFDQVFASPSNILQGQFPSDVLLTTEGHLLTANLGPTYPPAFGGPGTSGSIFQFDASTGAFTQNLTVSSFPDVGSGVTNFSPSQFTIYVGNTAPVANAGGPYSIRVGQPITVDASASRDPESDSLTFTWDINNDGVYGDAVGANPTLSWSQLQALGINATATTLINIHVAVADGHGHVASASAVLTGNQPPTLAAINPVTLNEDGGPQIVGLAGITDGGDGNQPLTVTATSSNPALIPNPPQVTYSSPNSTGSLSFTPVANAFGTATISVVVNDGQLANNTATRTFTITVDPVNDLPTLDTPNPMTINEDASAQTVTLTGVSAGPANESNQPLTVTASSSNPALILDPPLISYSSPSSTASLAFVPVANAYGSATITITVNDGQGVNNIVVKSFTITVNPVNHQPTLDTPNAVAMNEDAPTQTVTLTGMTAGPANESNQPLTVTASSSNPALIPDPPIVQYSTPNNTGTLLFRPVADAFGTATITVTVNDGQSTNNTVVRTFSVTVAPVNDLPTLDTPNPVTVNEDAPTQTVPLTGITAGPASENGQPLTVSATSSNPALIPDPPVVQYASPNSTGTLLFRPVADAFGTATITVTVNDGQSANNTVVRTFTVTVNPVNDLPTLDAPNAPPINEDAPVQTVPLTGITAGPANESGQPLTVSAFSSNPALVPNPLVNYSSGATGALTFRPNLDAFGTATISVVVNDGQFSNNTVTQTFTITVNPINDLPTLNGFNPLTLIRNAPQQTVNLTGISGGPANESQAVTVVATSSNTTLIPDPTVNYSSGSTGSLAFTPVFGASGTALITVTVNDGAGQNNAVIRTFQVTVI